MQIQTVISHPRYRNTVSDGGYGCLFPRSSLLVVMACRLLPNLDPLGYRNQFFVNKKFRELLYVRKDIRIFFHCIGPMSVELPVI